MATIRTRFDYIFNPKYPNEGGGLPMISLNAVEGNFELFGATVTCLPVKHGSAEVFGFRIGSFAYVTDVKTIPDSTMEKIMGVKTVVLGAVQRKPHSTHLGLYEAIDVIKKIGAQKGYITHMNHDLMRSEIEPTLPEGISLAYDGLVLNIEN
ncbi:MAG: MBL fold metallo-hydrolase [Nitrospinae bacterium]|nr:MBL fold metallo-hydrolase [Nitrospinota bacterium]